MTHKNDDAIWGAIKSIADKSRFIWFSIIAMIVATQLLNCGGNVEGALLMKDITLTCTAPNASVGMIGGQCDEYLVYFTTNPNDFKNKPITAISSVKSTNRPAVAGQPDTIHIQHMFPTGRTVYYKAVAGKYLWLNAVADTTKADSTLTIIYSPVLSNFAWRYLPPEQNEKPTAMTIGMIANLFGRRW